MDYLTTHTSLSPIRRVFAPGFVNYQNGCTRLAVARDKVYQLLAHGRWFSPGTPASSTTKTGRHDIAEILLKVALKHQNINQSIIYIKYILYYNICIFNDDKGPSWSLSYVSWIYNYLCNQCISPLTLWVRILLVARCTRYNIMWYSLSVTCGRSVVFSGYSGFLHQ